MELFLWIWNWKYGTDQRNYEKEQHKTIVETNAIPSGLRLIGDGFIFQQDNNLKHSSKLCRYYLEQKGAQGVLRNMAWLPRNPDLNPIGGGGDEGTISIEMFVIGAPRHIKACGRL